MKLLDFIFTKPKKQEPIKHDTKRLSSEKQYDAFHAYMRKKSMKQQLINDNEFLRDENRRLNNELAEHYFVVTAKANLLDVIIASDFILKSTLDKCIAELDEIDQIALLKAWNKGEL